MSFIAIELPPTNSKNNFKSGLTYEPFDDGKNITFLMHLELSALLCGLISHACF